MSGSEVVTNVSPGRPSGWVLRPRSVEALGETKSAAPMNGEPIEIRVVGLAGSLRAESSNTLSAAPKKKERKRSYLIWPLTTFRSWAATGRKTTRRRSSASARSLELQTG
jgi:hypothetical protein